MRRVTGFTSGFGESPVPELKRAISPTSEMSVILGALNALKRGDLADAVAAGMDRSVGASCGRIQRQLVWTKRDG